MRRGILLVAITATALPLTATSPADAGQDRYRTYAACGVGAHAQPSHVCDRQGRKAAFFKSLDADVTYRVCVDYPRGQHLCATAQDAPEDDLKVVEIFSSQRGRHTVKWFVGGERVGLWRFRNKNLG